MSTPATWKQKELAKEKYEKRTRVDACMPYNKLKNYQNYSKKICGGENNGTFCVSGSDKPRGYIANRYSRKAVKPIVKDLPDTMSYDEYQVSLNEIICFSGRPHFLSSLYSSQLEVEGHRYSSLEHYYQACKVYTLAGPRFAEQLRQIGDGGRVKMHAKKLLRAAKVPPEKIEAWRRSHGPVLLHHAIVHKFLQNDELRSRLLKTGNAILVHTYEYDNMFASGCTKDVVKKWAEAMDGHILKVPRNIDDTTLDYVPLVGEGKNILGFISMKVREQIRRYQELNVEGEVSPSLLAARFAGVKLDRKAGDGMQ